MSDKLVIIIQGPTTYYQSVIGQYNNYDRIIWSTWNSEPYDNLIEIEKAGITLCHSELPDIKGEWNCNLQCISVYNGVMCGKEKFPDADYFLKIRSDLIINNFEFFLKQVYKCVNENLSFLGYYKSKEKAYLLDYVIGGKYDDLINYFTPCTDSNCGLPFPEEFLQNRFYNGNPIYFKKQVYNLINISSIKIYWIKQNKFITQLQPSIQFNRQNNRLKNLLFYFQSGFQKYYNSFHSKLNK